MSQFFTHINFLALREMRENMYCAKKNYVYSNYFDVTPNNPLCIR